jgi:transcriptional regulator with XRE-family HTH domain
MDNRHEIREFLAARRAKLTPDQAGLPTFDGTRRVPGLRREEVALLAGVSVEYYTKLERGSLGGVSESVLESLARALQLTTPNASTCTIWQLIGELSTRSEDLRTAGPSATCASTAEATRTSGTPPSGTCTSRSTRSSFQTYRGSP